MKNKHDLKLLQDNLEYDYQFDNDGKIVSVIFNVFNSKNPVLDMKKIQKEIKKYEKKYKELKESE